MVEIEEEIIMKKIKLVITCGLLGMMLLGLPVASTSNPFSITAEAATLTQSARWEGSGDTWKVRNPAGGYLTNSWFQDDITGHWYMLGGDGVMYAGLVTDQSTGKTYLLNTNHDGTYGRMLTVDGVYSVNGHEVYLTFNQQHDGTFGAITSGLSEVRSSGVEETALENIPTDSAGGQQSNIKDEQIRRAEERIKVDTSNTNDGGGKVNWN